MQLAGLVSKEKITQEQADARREEILGLISGTTQYEGFGEVDFVVEAVPERMEVEQAVFARAGRKVTPGHAILASNTWALSISEIGSAELRAARQGRGFHFFYPASVMRLIEVVDRGRRHLGGDGAGGGQLRDADSQEPGSLRRGTRVRWLEPDS